MFSIPLCSARADSIPGLEIQADDVRCTHGSTTGKVDEELIFYAQTRGFTRKEATRMIVTGFFQQVFGPGVKAEEQSKAKLAFGK